MRRHRHDALRRHGRIGNASQGTRRQYRRGKDTPQNARSRMVRSLHSGTVGSTPQIGDHHPRKPFRTETERNGGMSLIARLGHAGSSMNSSARRGSRLRNLGRTHAAPIHAGSSMNNSANRGSRLRNLGRTHAAPIHAGSSMNNSGARREMPDANLRNSSKRRKS